ncbi:putative transcriptional regulator [Murinocardiopsis flavida]|uniref:Putative transcriptional regulator n=1 Tax=Murinocardiopsis flavida TaxID=645275 RepID=A0A2P8DG71_9ACTN|nr:BlaI/MecI/CopY family transcriptional regulator [Murinocardiopsis flavida]PSK96214.1 putative transcriptional regulator [Murinocardiopsis flavida]
MTGLGPLESAVMEALWQTGTPMIVRQVNEVMARSAHGRRDYSTVAGALMVLLRKRLVRRTRTDHTWWEARVSRAEYITDRIHGLLADAGDDRSGALALLVRQCTALDRADLRRALAEAEDGDAALLDLPAYALVDASHRLTRDHPATGIKNHRAPEPAPPHR